MSVLDMYVFVHSEDTKAVNAENAWSDFTVNLPNTVYLRNGSQWEVAVMELSVNADKYAIGRRELFEPLYLCCDNVETTVANAEEKKILTAFRLKESFRQVKNYPNPYYMKLVGDRLDSLRLYIKDRNGQSPSLVAGTTWCALHVRRQR